MEGIEEVCVVERVGDREFDGNRTLVPFLLCWSRIVAMRIELPRERWVCRPVIA